MRKALFTIKFLVKSPCHKNTKNKEENEIEEEQENAEEVDENVMSFWYRIVPFFTNLN